MKSFQECFFRALDSPLRVNASCRVSFRVEHEEGSNSFDRFISAVDNKLVWPELIYGEICLREISLPYDADKFCLTGLYKIEILGVTYLYISLTPRGDDGTNSCRILCFSLQVESDIIAKENTYELLFLQDFLCKYCPLDMQHIVSDKKNYAIFLGNDRALHFYDVDPCSGVLRRSPSARRKRLRQSWADRVGFSDRTNRMDSASQQSMPLRLLCQQWEEITGENKANDSKSGNQALIGHVDGLLLWFLGCEDDVGTSKDQESCNVENSRNLAVDCPEEEKCIPSDNCFDHDSGSGSDGKSQESNLSPSVIALEETFAFEQARGTPSLFSFSEEERGVGTLEVVAEEDEEDEINDIREEASVTLGPQDKIISSAEFDKLKDALLSTPFYTNCGNESAYSGRNALLLDGCVTCMSFFQRESHTSVNFRRHFESAYKENYSSNESDSVIAQVTPSPAVLVGLSEGTVAMLSQESRSIRSLLLQRNDDPSSSLGKSDSQHHFQGVMALCVADISQNSINDVIVGYHDGLVRVSTLVENGEITHIDDCNSEGWSVGSCCFLDIAHISVPYPVVGIEYGQLLGSQSKSGKHDLTIKDHLIVYTTCTVHVFFQLPDEESVRKENMIERLLSNIEAAL